MNGHRNRFSKRFLTRNGKSAPLWSVIVVARLHWSIYMRKSTQLCSRTLATVIIIFSVWQRVTLPVCVISSFNRNSNTFSLIFIPWHQSNQWHSYLEVKLLTSLLLTSDRTQDLSRPCPCRPPAWHSSRKPWVVSEEIRSSRRYAITVISTGTVRSTSTSTASRSTSTFQSQASLCNSWQVFPSVMWPVHSRKTDIC